ncbi:MAG: hypothetical protein KBT10_07875, partial [Bacteroidales bacterium]|nr:hypothetical protein [Candidatus Sodaliphilus aphodohippi]
MLTLKKQQKLQKSGYTNANLLLTSINFANANLKQTIGITKFKIINLQIYERISVNRQKSTELQTQNSNINHYFI